MKMTGLERLYRAMRRDRISRAAFSYHNNKAHLEVAFSTDSDPYTLLIAVRGVGVRAIEVAVERGYLITPYLDSDLGTLMDMLGVESNPGNRFGVRKFFEDLDQHVPDHMNRPVRAAAPELLACKPGLVVEEADKVFFLGWLVHDEAGGKHVSSSNLAKTLALIGRVAHRNCTLHNISSRWTADPKQRRDVTTPPISL